ncbi:MAG: hypothetical protein HYX76_08495 [Acidobacteria bacterium]|nr:hypothetical protein [Acidobacteriota bacterium]
MDLPTIEFEVLRQTIRERGTVRVVLAWLTVVAWAVLLVTTASLTRQPLAMLVPLMVLGAGFEATYALHTNVERIGRYVQVAFEEHGERPRPQWETTAMGYGAAYKSGGPDALFAAVFGLALALNFVAAALRAVGPELAVLAVIHAGLVARIALARRYAARQRAKDLERFRRLRKPPETPST